MGSAVAITTSRNFRSHTGLVVDTQIVGCNAAALKLFGMRDQSELIGMSWSALRPAEDELFSNRRFAVMSEFPDADVPSQFPCTILRADGDRIQVRKTSEVWYDKGGVAGYHTVHERIKRKEPIPDLDWHALGLTDEIYIKHCGFGNMTEAETLMLQNGLSSLYDSPLSNFMQFLIQKRATMELAGGEGKYAWRVRLVRCPRPECGYVVSRSRYKPLPARCPRKQCRHKWSEDHAGDKGSGYPREVDR